MVVFVRQNSSVFSINVDESSSEFLDILDVFKLCKILAGISSCEIFSKFDGVRRYQRTQKVPIREPRKFQPEEVVPYLSHRCTEAPSWEP
jgi:hypothetical protein